MLNTEELYNEVIGEILARRNKVFRSELRRQMMGQPAANAWQVLIDGEKLDCEWGALQTEAENIFEDLLPRRVAPMPGLRELLEQLRILNIPHCVATSSQRSFALRAIGLVNLLETFSFIVTAEDVPRGKPHPDIYQLAATKFGFRPEEMLVLEDSRNGALSGVAAGACVIAVPGEHSADHVFSDVHAVASSLLDPVIRRSLPSTAE